MGIGAGWSKEGWCKEEVAACGYDFGDRGERCDEMLELTKSLWTEPVTNHSGKHFQVMGCRMDPKPVQKPHIPIIVGGSSPAAPRRAARVGSGWLGFGLNPTNTRGALATIDAAPAAEGRTRDDLDISITPVNLDANAAREFHDLGVDRLVPLLDASNPKAVNDRFRQLEEFANMVA